MKKYNITYKESISLIQELGLKPYFEAWHYTFRPEFYDTHIITYFKKEKIVNILFPCLHVHAPAPLFTNITNANLAQTDHSIKDNYNRKSEYKRLYWFLKITTFEDFLHRKTTLSNSPRKHFPTKYTYSKTIQDTNTEIQITDFEKSFFCEHFDMLKRDHFLKGSEVVDIYNRYNKIIPKEWLKSIVLLCDGKPVSIALAVDDGKSFSLINITAQRAKISYGVILCTEIIRIACERQYYSFDACVSSVYGSYQHKIFLDTKEIYFKENNSNLLLKGLSWSKRKIMILLDEIT